MAGSPALAFGCALVCPLFWVCFWVEGNFLATLLAAAGFAEAPFGATAFLGALLGFSAGLLAEVAFSGFASVAGKAFAGCAFFVAAATFLGALLGLGKVFSALPSALA